MGALSLTNEERQLVAQRKINQIGLYINSDGIEASYVNRGTNIVRVPWQKLSYKGTGGLVVPPSWYGCDCTEDAELGEAFASAMTDFLAARKHGLPGDALTFVCVNIPERDSWKKEAEAFRGTLHGIFEKSFPKLRVLLCGLPESIAADDPVAKQKSLALHVDGEWSEFTIRNAEGSEATCHPLHLGFGADQKPEAPVKRRINVLAGDPLQIWEACEYPSWTEAFRDACAKVQKFSGGSNLMSARVVCPGPAWKTVAAELKASGLCAQGASFRRIERPSDNILAFLQKSLHALVPPEEPKAASDRNKPKVTKWQEEDLFGW